MPSPREDSSCFAVHALRKTLAGGKNPARDFPRGTVKDFVVEKHLLYFKKNVNLQRTVVWGRSDARATQAVRSNDSDAIAACAIKVHSELLDGAAVLLRPCFGRANVSIYPSGNFSFWWRWTEPKGDVTWNRVGVTRKRAPKYTRWDEWVWSPFERNSVPVVRLACMIKTRRYTTASMHGLVADHNNGAGGWCS